MNPESARRVLVAESGADQVSLSTAGSVTSALVAGSGRPILLLHGLNAAGGLVWWPVLPRLADQFKVFAPDLPGLGESQQMGNRADSSNVVDWLSGVVGECSQEPVILVATSLAGGFALRFADAHADLLRGLILTDAQGLAPFRPPPGLMIATVRNSFRPSQTAMRRLVRYVVHDEDHVREVHGPLWDLFIEYMVARADRREVKRALRSYSTRANSRPVNEATLARVGPSGGMIWGRHDRPFPGEHPTAIRLATRNRRGRRTPPLHRAAIEVRRSRHPNSRPVLTGPSTGFPDLRHRFNRQDQLVRWLVERNPNVV